MSELSQRLGFDLTDSLAGDREVLTNLFQRWLAAVRAKTEPHLDYFFFARRQRFHDFLSHFANIGPDHGIGWIRDCLIFDEVAQVRVFFLADRRFQRDRLLSNLQDLPNLGYRDVHSLSDLFGRRLASKLLNKRARRSYELVDRIDHMDGYSNCASLIGDSARDCLPYPPRSISRELIPAPPFELINSLHQADVAFLNEVQKLQAAVGIFLRD